ncbi:hypothetical protein NDU88_004355 [Pleurodeles waltl]|uniref:Uncharacterized protein n=1 Tax=Pleurodeles waltl TaxID=8319 RepID=A0AAV7T953_PLEWA|nr:hypothetical protein NDU88_004355 [Pleurodeles waltl]
MQAHRTRGHATSQVPAVTPTITLYRAAVIPAVAASARPPDLLELLRLALKGLDGKWAPEAYASPYFPSPNGSTTPSLADRRDEVPNQGTLDGGQLGGHDKEAGYQSCSVPSNENAVIQTHGITRYH